MNRYEKIVYDILKSNPRLKTGVRNIYQGIFDCLPEKGNYFVKDVQVFEGFFFGFHDLSPFSSDDRFLLANRLEIGLRMPEKGDPLSVGYFDLNSGEYCEIGKSTAWNYHKGCRLQWCGSDDFIIYNSLEGKLCSIISEWKTGKKRKIDFPIDTCSHDGEFAASFSYERLNAFMPGYGYIYEDEGYVDDRVPDHTGLMLIDLKNNSRKQILSIKELAFIRPEKSMVGASHFITHTEFSPDDKRIAFLHRWVEEDIQKRHTRLITCNLDGSDIAISPTDGMVSHYIWTDKNEILAYCRVDSKDGFYLFKDAYLKEPVHVATALNSDGHPSFVNGTDYFITDTYPDYRRYAKIYCASLSEDKTRKIVEVKSYKKFQSPDLYHHIACDLHPRISRSGKYISFDSVHTGQRSLCIMKTEQLFSEQSDHRGDKK